MKTFLFTYHIVYVLKLLIMYNNLIIMFFPW